MNGLASSDKRDVINICGVRKNYGSLCAVDGVDLAIAEGEIFGLIGHNGAGKSTLFKMLLGLVPLTAGTITVDSQPVHGELFRQVRRRLGYLPENVVFYDNLTGAETLTFFARLKGCSDGDRTALLERVGLAAAGHRRVREYSKGMRQRLGLAQALLGKPRLLFLDEPTTGLDPEGIREFYRILREQRDGGTTIILTSHILSEIQERVDRLAIMKSGRIEALGTVQSLRESMNLPLGFALRLATGLDPAALASELQAQLAPLAIRVMPVAGQLQLDCPRDAKMAVMAALAPLTVAGHLIDIQVREPSLEDVFLGYSG
jgi:Cu-processing system ATP-binding protein